MNFLLQVALLIVAAPLIVNSAREKQNSSKNSSHHSISSATISKPDRKSRCSKDKDSKENVLVTGINGLIGSHVAKELVKTNCYNVFGLVRPRSNLDSLISILTQVQLIIGDITDPFRMIDIMNSTRPTYLYHFAAQAINSISYDNPDLTLEVNVKGTLNLLEALRRNQLTSTRFLLAGSSTEYGRTADTYDGPIPETAKFDPVSPYGASKVAAENLATQYFRSYHIPVITARFFIQVGVGGTPSLALQDFARQVALIELGVLPPVIKHGNLDTKRDITDARDSAPVVVQLAEAGVPGEAYNVGTGVGISTSDLLDIILAQSNKKIVRAQEASRLRLYDEKVLVCDNSKVRALTGWKPNVNMTDTVTAVLTHWRRTIHYLYG